MEPYLIMPSQPVLASPAVARDRAAGLLLEPLVHRHWRCEWGEVSEAEARRFTATAHECPLVATAVKSLFRTPFGPIEIVTRPGRLKPVETLVRRADEHWPPPPPRTPNVATESAELDDALQ